MTPEEQIALVHDISDIFSYRKRTKKKISDMKNKGRADADDLKSQVEDIVSRLEELRDEQEQKKDNMPEGLQEGDVGQLLQERYDALDNAINEIEGIDLDYDEPDEAELREEAIESLGLTPHTDDDDEEEKDEDDEKEELNEHGFTEDEEKQIESKIEELQDEKFAEWRDEKCDELSNISFE